jgi:glycosyltransferase involved in cell wall biosynthesis
MKKENSVCLFMVPLLNHGGGAEKYFVNLAHNLSLEGKRIDVITLDKSFARFLTVFVSIYYRKNLFEVITNGNRERTENILNTLKPSKWRAVSLLDLKKTLNGYDIVYTRNELLDLLILKIVGFKKNVIIGFHTPSIYPYTITIQEKIHNLIYKSNLYSLLLNISNTFHVVNKFDYMYFKRRFPTKKVLFIPYPFDAKRKITIDKNDKLNILFVGRIEYQKGIDIFADIIKKINQKGALNMRFKIAGSGDPEWVKSINKLQEKHLNIQYHGHVPNKEINQLYQWADVVVIPSRYETTNYVALEAGVNKKIAMASNIPGPSDVIDDGKTGFLLELDSQVFINKLQQLYELKRNNIDKFTAIGAAAQKYISNKFNNKIIMKKMKNLLFPI